MSFSVDEQSSRHSERQQKKVATLTLGISILSTSLTKFLLGRSSKSRFKGRQSISAFPIMSYSPPPPRASFSNRRSGVTKNCIILIFSLKLYCQPLCKGQNLVILEEEHIFTAMQITTEITIIPVTPLLPLLQTAVSQAQKSTKSAQSKWAPWTLQPALAIVIQIAQLFLIESEN